MFRLIAFHCFCPLDARLKPKPFDAFRESVWASSSPRRIKEKYASGGCKGWRALQTPLAPLDADPASSARGLLSRLRRRGWETGVGRRSSKNKSPHLCALLAQHDSPSHGQKVGNKNLPGVQSDVVAPSPGCHPLLSKQKTEIPPGAVHESHGSWHIFNCSCHFLAPPLPGKALESSLPRWRGRSFLTLANEFWKVS